MALSLHKRWEIIFLSRHRLGPKLPNKRIANELAVSVHTVEHWLEVYDATNDVIEQDKPGRPRATTARQDQTLIEYAEAHGEASSSTMAGQLKRKRVEVSPRTVRRRLNEAGISSLRPTFAPLLNKKCRKARLDWAKKNKTRNWKRVLFSDETTFELYRPRPRVWRRKGEPVLYGTVKHPLKVQVWGCLSSNGFGHISTFSGNLNARTLCKIYNKSLLPSAAEAFGAKGKWTLQEDNDPKHRSALAQMWRKDNKVSRMDWPSQSPDMNPIENVWAILKANVASHEPKSKKSLIRWMRYEWKRLPRDYAIHLINSMDERVNTLIQCKGDNTRF